MSKNKYVGKCIKTGINIIDMPFTRESLDLLLNMIISANNTTLSHQDFANWCESFYWNIENNDSLKHDAQYRNLSEALNDIFMQWDLYLVNAYNLEELQTLDFSKVELPIEWFRKWLMMINRVL